MTQDVMLCPSGITDEDIKKNEHHYLLFDGLSDWNLKIPKYRMDIDPDTLCQFVGQTDKYGKKIFEHDIVKYWKEDGYEEILWDDCTSRFIISYDGLIIDFDNVYGYDLEVIGNSIDNPKLLMVNDEECN